MVYQAERAGASAQSDRQAPRLERRLSGWLSCAVRAHPYGTWDYRKWKRGQEDAKRDARA